MGRPPLRIDAKVRKRTIWMHDDQVERVIALVGKQGLSDFIRRATGVLLDREEAPADKREKPAEAPPTAEPKRTGTIEDLFGDD